MSPVEKEHIIRAYTFELSKCYEQAIKERQLRCLANIDPTLCAEVATGLGLPAPEPTVPLAEPNPSPALSQVGQRWPADGRIIGIVVGPDADLAAVGRVRAEVFAAGMVPLVIAPHGGMVGDLPVQRTFATARSVEYDALLLAAAPAPAPDALPARDDKAGAAGPAVVDPRVLLLVDECWRQAKAIGAWDAGRQVVADAGLTGAAGIVADGSASEVVAAIGELLGGHRVWERFPATVS
jgi:catalase